MNYKVLVVDDSKLARMVMASAFRRIRPDWSLIETSNADEALATVSEGAVDIALIDFNMPGTDGLELVATSARATRECRSPWSPRMSRTKLLGEPDNWMQDLSLSL